ncbi:MAG: cupin domain-containing protein [Anaerolineae bacterium]
MELVRKPEYLSADRETIQAQHRFTGQVTVHRILGDHPRVRVSSVSFQAGARTFWHAHGGEQILYVVEGRGRVQEWGEPALDIGPGDIVHIGPGEKHWHGATADVPLTHIAITMADHAGRLEIDWMEEV